MAEYRKLHDVEYIGKLENDNGYIFKDINNKLYKICSNDMEDRVTNGEFGLICYKSSSSGGTHVFKKSL